VILTVIEPSYFGTISTWAQICSADVQVIADTFKFKKHSAINRTAIKTITGRSWLTIPVQTRGQGDLAIQSVRIDRQQPWQSKHLRSLERNYQNAPYFIMMIDAITDCLQQQPDRLSPFLIHSMQVSGQWLTPRQHWVESTALPEQFDRTRRVLAWLDATGCNEYLLLPHETGLIDMDRLWKAGVELWLLSGSVSAYHQQYDGFIPGCSILDLLFNEGPGASLFFKNLKERLNSDQDSKTVRHTTGGYHQSKSIDT
jgi:hypothetical protein